jgi:isoleucyl-tRNA synthetase
VPFPVILSDAKDPGPGFFAPAAFAQNDENEPSRCSKRSVGQGFVAFLKVLARRVARAIVGAVGLRAPPSIPHRGRFSRAPASSDNLVPAGRSKDNRVHGARKRGESVAPTNYKSTLHLPKTDFPMKANLPKREPEILKRWEEMDLYGEILKTRGDAPLWVLHDGPPYANGQVHVGTALNKILKDFVVRSRSMMGYRTPFVPGWDCHGMPIEHQVSRDLGPRARTIPKLELRKLCRAHAEKFIDLQRRDFKRLGVIGDWANPYLTFTPEYDAAEIGVLRKLVEDGYVYRGLRPVHWCFSCRTALAEAEVEYHDHRSPSIYVAFRLNEKLRDAAALATDRSKGAALAVAHGAGKLFAAIWTTTPWTLPANLGITLNASFDYVALRSGENFYIVAARLADVVEKATGLRIDERIALDRAALKALDGQDVFSHPFADRDARLMFGDHVTLEAGTGLVHTAPGHGYDDFVVGNQYKLQALTPVDDGGVFTSEAGVYAGGSVFESNDRIVEDLRKSGALLHAETLGHSYPHCWRCHNPVIFRATEQWFLRVDHHGLRQRALGEIDKVQWIPKWSRDRIRNMVETRPDWCLSRQRAWGVPIPALKCTVCGLVTLEPAVMKRVEEIFAREGSDAWYVRPASDFAGDQRCSSCGGASFDKTEDILDVWFDSGCSHAAVLARRPDLKWPADLYVEGVDQHRGWFQGSLITAIATHEDSPNAAPYAAVLTHGLALDEAGRKMSKSLGNTENAEDAVARVGADLIRLVFASVDFSSDMNVSENLFNSVAESYRKLRNTCRFMLGNLADFDPARDRVALDQMLEFDRYALARTEQLKGEVARDYDEYDFRAVSAALVNFAVVDLSSLYIDVARDRLYCSAAGSRERRSAQTAIYEMLDVLVRMLAPLIPFTAEEIYSHFPGERGKSVHLLEFAKPRPEWSDDRLEARWRELLAMRAEALKVLEALRQRGTIGAPLDAAIRIGAVAGDDGPAGALEAASGQLKELFIVSDVKLLDPAETARLKGSANGGETFATDGAVGRVSTSPALVVVGEHAPGIKCQRCWSYFDDGGDPELCQRCRAVVRA